MGGVLISAQFKNMMNHLLEACLIPYFGHPEGRHLARSGKDADLQWPVAPCLLGTSWATHLPMFPKIWGGTTFSAGPVFRPRAAP